MIGLLCMNLAFAADPADQRIPAAVISPVMVERIALARDLMRYDMIAWLTTDAVMAEDVASQLGRAWFVLFEDPLGVGVYGRFDSDTGHFVHVRSYSLAADRTTTRIEAAPPPEVADPRARAIATVWSRPLPADMRKLMRVGVNPNQYVFVNEDRSIDVWLIPELASDGRLIAGTCADYTLDPTGGRILRQTVEHRKPRVYTQGKDVRAEIDSISADIPTTCELYWALYYADNFERLSIRTPTLEMSFVELQDFGRVPVYVAR